jgi:rubrerythrin
MSDTKDLRKSLTQAKEAPSAASLSLDEKIQRKLRSESGARRVGRRPGNMTMSLPPGSVNFNESDAAEDGGDAPSKDDVRKALLEKRKEGRVAKHLCASLKMSMNHAAFLNNMSFSDSEEEKEETKGWECKKCTFLNRNEEHLACSVCTAPRYDG